MNLRERVNVILTGSEPDSKYGEVMQTIQETIVGMTNYVNFSKNRDGHILSSQGDIRKDNIQIQAGTVEFDVIISGKGVPSKSLFKVSVSNKGYPVRLNDISCPDKDTLERNLLFVITGPFVSNLLHTWKGYYKHV